VKRNYEDAPEYSEDAYQVDGHRIAYYVLGWETEPDEDTHWSGYENRTGRLVMVMVGDDHHWSVDPEDVTTLEPEAFCRTCGQVGCGRNVYS
jgi:hypothetical protein